MKVYSSDPSTESGGRVKVGIADYAVATGDARVVTSGLGSCVGVALYDPDAGIVGLAHAMLPEYDGSGDEAKYVDTVVPALVDEMRAKGADSTRMVAKLAGGSEMFEFTDDRGSIGRRNVEAARTELAALGIEIEREDVGGDHGRSLELHADTGALQVRSANQGETTL